MSFIAKKDWFGLATASGGALVVSDSADGKSAQNVTALKEDGSVGANTVFAQLVSPSNTYKLSGTVGMSAVIGGTLSSDQGEVMLGQVSINTAAGGEPTVQASGQQVETNASTNTCTYTVSVSGLTPKRHAQILFSAFTVGGTGCFLTNANYEIQANIGIATVNGEPVASDVTEGMITASVTITQTGSTEPTVTAGSDWQITSPLACTNPDANYPTWTCTLTKYLQKDS